jgi:3-oxoisoapionate decarboxylase
MLTRRELVQSLVATAVASPLAAIPMPTRSGAQEGTGTTKASRSSFGFAYTSFAVRMLQGRDIMKSDAARLTAAAFVDLCHQFGSTGCQVDLSQFESHEPEYVDRVRAAIEAKQLFVELSAGARYLESAEAFDRAAAVAKRLGATRIRVALLSGRRYETFRTTTDWQAFSDKWRRALPAIKGPVEHHGLQIGIENHKDWTARELAALLGEVDSPLVGACIDFGNNLALMEDPLETVSTLAPFGVTTHLKDMAVRPADRGFELSEVPLGAGLLPLGSMIAAVRAKRPDIHLCLEMITRDPLLVPCKDESYWPAFGGPNPGRVEQFDASIMRMAWHTPLPRISGLPPADQVRAEDENLRRSVAFARETMHL